MEEFFNSKGVRITDFRRKVVNIINKSDLPVSIKDIENSLENFDRVTLYRTIKLLIEKGIIHEIVMASSKDTMYAMCSIHCSSVTHNHEHIHFKCNKCEIVYCLEIEHFPEIKVPFFQIDTVDINTSGVCKACA